VALEPFRNEQVVPCPGGSLSAPDPRRAFFRAHSLPGGYRILKARASSYLGVTHCVLNGGALPAYLKLAIPLNPAVPQADPHALNDDGRWVSLGVGGAELSSDFQAYLWRSVWHRGLPTVCDECHLKIGRAVRP